ncbi:MAG: D-glycero-beta-D-manno-heptose-7-phosphate kinase [Lentisphaerae bacterium]|nr:D-glycero-beta-D-manno-heptose-7-phosphate kinase [Lentisphaerota bacterium]MCP4102294.1 D-glycero-beta-D-manno-heptose-7-phosphate kinase [Lentisphaerota bacterium]
MKKKRLEQIVRNFSNVRIAVVGDLMLDVYIWGDASRISPEAPVPVVQVKEKSSCLGGAANVMRNVVTLGGKVSAYGVVGDDYDGREVGSLLKKYDIDPSTLSVTKERRTTNKQRVIASAQQLLRVDFEDTIELDEAIRQQIVEKLIMLIENKAVDAVIFEDYGKGVLSEKMLQTVIDAARENGIITALDPKPGHLMQISNLTVMKPNRNEAFAMTGMFQRKNGCSVEKDTDLHEVADRLLEQWQPEQLLISLASQGMALFRDNADMVVIPTRAREVYDVSGAGDTVIAAYTLSIAAGANPEEAAEIANHAAGIVVGKVGTVTVSKEELIDSFWRED